MATKTWPLPSDCVHFVDSIHSEEFSLFLQALDRAYIVAMDAEWKPLRSNNTRTFPRVSIMQLACRLATDDEDLHSSANASTSSETEETGKTILPALTSVLDHDSSIQSSYEELDTEEYQDENVVSANDGTEFIELPEAQGSVLYENHINRVAVVMNAEPQTSGTNLKEGEKCLKLSLSRLKEEEEVIFLLDVMSLPAYSFWEAMKKMLVSPTVLKLGFKFKQDLVNLAKSFPGPDAHSCFDKVDPYVDIGKLFLELCGWDGKPGDSMSLATICEKVVGYTLCKDLQCSDWEQRPLTVEQQVYAAADAHCLVVAYDVLKSEALKGHEYSIECTTASAKDGIGVLLSDSTSPFLNYSGGNILHARRGVATIMVRTAVSTGVLLTARLHTVVASSQVAAHMFFVNKFGERLLVNEERSKKSVRKKSKGNHVIREIRSGAQGPPPWDPSCGGDGTPKFLCDNMVEGLAKHLRNIGIDTALLRTRKSDPRKMVELAEKEARVVLTQDVKLLQRGLIPPNLAYRVKSNGKQEQLAEVVKVFNLEVLEDNLLSRCTKCNGVFFPNALTPEEALAAVPEGQTQTFPEYAIKQRLLFWQCSQCRQIYWQGKQFYRALQSFQAFAHKVQTSQ